MKSKRSLRFFSNTLTAAGLALAVSACSTLYKDDWDQTTNVPDLNDPTQRSQALLEYCKKLHSRGDLNLAAGICNRAHEINPTDPVPLIELARVLEQLEMSKSAEDAYRAALLLDPGQTDALYGLGRIYIDRQRYDLAMEPLEAAAQQDTEDPRIYNALGVIMDQQGQHAEAQAYYRQGLAHSPRNVSLRNNLGLSMVLDGQPEAGLAMLREVAAEPAAGATASRNLEMASQIAAKSALAKTGANMSALDSAEPKDGTGISQQSPHGGLWPTRELARLEPASGMHEPKAPASEPLPLLRPYHQNQVGDTAPAAAPVSPPRHGRSLDQELADAMAEDTTAGSGTQLAEAVESKSQTAAQPQAEPATEQVTATPRDWSLAAETVFATSRVAVAEPPQTAAPDPAPAAGASRPTEAAAASAEPASEPAKAAPGDPRGDMAITPASAADEAEAQTAAIPDGYSLEEDTFYTAQLASFRTAARAREGWRILKESAGDLLDRSDAFIVRADLGGEMGTYYRIRTGTMSDHAAARQFCLDLQAQGVECLAVEASWQETNETLVDTICQNGSTGVLCGTAERSDVERVGPPFARG